MRCVRSIRSVGAVCLGTLVLVVIAFADTTSKYQYDALGRLTRVVDTATGYITAYGYDAAGNRTVTSSGPDQTPPSVPTGLNGSAASASQINLNWSAATDNVGVAGYRIYRNGTQVGTSTSTTYADTTVVHSTQYSYTVAAYDVGNNLSAQSAAKIVSTPDQTPPSVPTLAAAAASPSQINLSWSASSDSGGSGLAGYRLYRGPTLIATTGSTSFSDTGLASTTSYTYTVYAFDNAGYQSPASNVASATTWSNVSVAVSATSWKWVKRNTNPTKIDPPVICSGSGGSGFGYTYAWQRISGDPLAVALRANFPDTIWWMDVPFENNSWVSTWRCLVTDSGGNTGQNTVVVTFTRATNQ